MIRSKITSSLTLIAATLAGIGLFASNANAQSWGWGWRNMWGWDQQIPNRNTLRSDVNSFDRLADQMVYQFSREMNYRCSCSAKLLTYLKKNASLSRNLVTAINGNCKSAFRKAASALNSNTASVARQSRNVRDLSCSMKGDISETVSLAKRIERNADQFVPKNSSYTNNHPSTPTYGRQNNNRNRYDNHDRYANNSRNQYRNNDRYANNRGNRYDNQPYTNDNRNRYDNSNDYVNNNRDRHDIDQGYANDNRNRYDDTTNSSKPNDQDSLMALLRSLLGGHGVPGRTSNPNVDNHSQHRPDTRVVNQEFTVNLRVTGMT